MFNGWLRRKAGTMIALVAAGLLAAYVYVSREQAAAYEGPYDAARAKAFFDAAVWESGAPGSETMTTGGRTFAKAAGNGSFSLWLEPATGRIALRDERSGGATLFGNPGDDALASETVKGQWRSHLSSPLLFRYLAENDTKETQGNLVDRPARTDWRPIPNGVGVRYAVDELGFQFYVEYALHADGLSVRIPENGLLETKANKLVSVEPLPFFGAAQGSAEGYLLVPDGPGGLISFGARRPERVTPYDRPVYGPDRAVPQPGGESARSPVDYPVFGINRGDGGFLAVIDRGAFRANVYASPAGVHTSFHAAGAKFAVRRAYDKPAGLNKKRTAYDASIVSSEMGVHYTVLPEGRADYVAMAKAYRSYISEEYGLAPMREASGKPPLYLDAVLAASETARFGTKTVAATTTGRVREMVAALADRGVERLEVGLIGWNAGGYPGKLPNRLPAEPAVGGERGLRELLATAEPGRVGYYLVDTLRLATNRWGSGFRMKDAVRTLDRRILPIRREDELAKRPPTYYLVRPQAMEAALEKALPAYERLGASGVGYVEMSRADGDYGRAEPSTRERTAQSLRRAFERTAAEVGRVTLYGSPAFALGRVSHLAEFPVESNHDFVVDETVPFYPIALHGLVSYSAEPGNTSGDRVNAFLRAIEYGALPHFIVTDENPRLLKETEFAFLYSSRFDDLKERIAEEYRAFAEVGDGVWGQAIAGHRRLAEGVYETVYERGRTVWVNYNERPFEMEGRRVEPRSYKVVKEGGAS
ncbi:DUF5696 domain-containing protein [Paenibacillus flagellatus]|uniref:Uncharacterized protein n=1 Tax=Paenibacillus flagellatus TaxID=2211139 RepID=A0A2V5K9L1_9BACL|nr:DUF5696 domain-containing protein [Paenibacillus flagellatus]PYI56181.1 hypothetical protein DLM86_04115 [Paenibacillus flagellatus]